MYSIHRCLVIQHVFLVDTELVNQTKEQISNDLPHVPVRYTNFKIMVEFVMHPEKFFYFEEYGAKIAILWFVRSSKIDPQIEN